MNIYWDKLTNIILRKKVKVYICKNKEKNMKTKILLPKDSKGKRLALNDRVLVIVKDENGKVFNQYRAKLVVYKYALMLKLYGNKCYVGLSELCETTEILKL